MHPLPAKTFNDACKHHGAGLTCCSVPACLSHPLFLLPARPATDWAPPPSLHTRGASLPQAQGRRPFAGHPPRLSWARARSFSYYPPQAANSSPVALGGAPPRASDLGPPPARLLRLLLVAEPALAGRQVDVGGVIGAAARDVVDLLALGVDVALDWAGGGGRHALGGLQGGRRQGGDGRARCGRVTAGGRGGACESAAAQNHPVAGSCVCRPCKPAPLLGTLRDVVARTVRPPGDARAGRSLVSDAAPVRGWSLRHCAGSWKLPAQMPRLAACACSSKGTYSLLYCLRVIAAAGKWRPEQRRAKGGLNSGRSSAAPSAAGTA